MLILFGRTVVLLVTASAVGLAFNAVRPDGVHWLGQTAMSGVTSMCAQTTTAAIAVTPTIEVLSPAHAAALCGDPRTLIADARAADAFAEGHVAGAIHLPCASTRGAATAALDLLAGKETLIVYGRDTNEAIPVADEMRRQSGRPDVRVAVLAGGFAAWNQAGLACSSGPCRDCAHPVSP